MKVSVCVCCGQPITENAGPHSRNPNICAACAELADGLEIPSLPKQIDATSAKVQLPKENLRLRKAA